jgi:hypothetical protein
MKRSSGIWFALLLGATVALQPWAVLAKGPSDGHKLAIQINDKNPATINIALNNAANVIKHFGPANVEVEIVAYGPGLEMFHKDSKLHDRLASLYAFGNVHYGVCENTMKKMKWEKKDLLSDAFVQDAIVPSGVVRLMELQEQGYAYIRP